MKRGEPPPDPPDLLLLDQVMAALWDWIRPQPNRAGEYEIRVAIGNIRTAQVKSRIERMEKQQ